jgi:hypothetical protein
MRLEWGCLGERVGLARPVANLPDETLDESIDVEAKEHLGDFLKRVRGTVRFTIRD